MYSQISMEWWTKQKPKIVTQWENRNTRTRGHDDKIMKMRAVTWLSAVIHVNKSVNSSVDKNSTYFLI